MDGVDPPGVLADRGVGTALFDTAPHPILVLNDALRVQAANAAFHTAFAVPPDAVPGRSVFRLDDDRWDVPALHHLLEERLPRDGVVTNYEVDLPATDGAARRLRINARRVEPGSHIVLAVDDVSEPRQTKQALARLQAQYDWFMSSIMEGYCMVEVLFDEDGRAVDYRFLETNEAFEAQTGLVGAEGQRMRALEPDHEPKWFEIYGRVARTGQPVRFTHRAEQLGGRWYDVSAFRVGAPEEHRVAIFLMDVTQRETLIDTMGRERDFTEAVLDTIGALIVVVDRAGRIVRFNKKCEAVTGYTFDEVQGKELLTTLVPPEEQMVVRRIAVQHRQGSGRTVNENHWMTKSGERRLIRWTSTVLRDADGRITHGLGTGIDITVRRRLEREVVAASDAERRRIGRELHDMLASQLAGTTLVLEAQATKADRGDPVTADALRQATGLIKEASDQVRTLSHALMPLKVKGEGLVDGLAQLAARRDALRSEVTCTFQAGAPLPEVTEDQAAHLYRLASEAVSNAFEHADPEVVEITLAGDEDALTLTVRDDGVGIPDKEPNPDASDGLGLRMMQYRAELIGAQLTIEPGPSGGTVVRCRLPMRRLRGRI